MDKRTLKLVTSALDIAIVTAANEQLVTLKKESSNQDITEGIRNSLRAFQKLTNGGMPHYNEWDALLYSTWYQPGHINMAYSLIQSIPFNVNPFAESGRELYVNDFGCGELAMQLALVLGAARSLESGRKYPRFIINSTDPSRSMTDLGWKIWRYFKDEIGDLKAYPGLDALRQACRDLRFDYPEAETPTRWFSLFHVAYKETAPAVREMMSNYVASGRPDVVLVTFRQANSEYAYSPEDLGYKGTPCHLQGNSFALQGCFSLATKFRVGLHSLFNECAKDSQHVLKLDDVDFVRRYLVSSPTLWVTHKFEANCFVYTKNQLTFDEIDDLPF